MTENEIKEELSKAFIAMIATQSGYKVQVFDRDHGTDVMLVEVVSMTNPDGSQTYTDSGRILNIQLKATIEGRVNRSNGVIAYVLEGKTYNKMVHRKASQKPLLLFVIILPDDRQEWLCCDPECITAKRHAYWYDMPAGMEMANHNSRKTIHIPQQNLVNLDTIPGLFDIFQPLTTASI